MSPKYSLFYGDFHFHTDFSDNRDRAPLARMVELGEKRGIRWFGTGDHDHNLSERKWKDQREETAALRKSRPDLRVMNNCEITFRRGHFLVMEPASVRGRALDGFRWLMGEGEEFLILNHPFQPPFGDNWGGSLIPHVSGIEVVNGDLLRKAGPLPLKERSSLLDSPWAACYGEYLSRGVPVLPFGSSDAHRLDVMGLGVTGYWSGAGEGPREIIAQGKSGQGRQFAATDTGISLFLKQEPGGVLEASGRFTDAPADWGLPEGELRLEWYRGKQLIASRPLGTRLPGRTLSFREELTPSVPGFYWCGVNGDGRFALSSPVALGNFAALTAPVPEQPSGLDDIRDGLAFRGADPADQRPLWLPREELSLFLEGPPVEASDRYGRPCALSWEGGEEEVIIRRRAPRESFEEFFLWLRRNEIHEYKFCRIAYSIEEGVLTFSGRLIPALGAESFAYDRATPLIGEEIRRRWEEIRLTEVDVRILPRYRCRPREETALPVRICDGRYGLSSLVAAPAGGKPIQLF